MRSHAIAVHEFSGLEGPTNEEVDRSDSSSEVARIWRVWDGVTDEAWKTAGSTMLAS